MAKGKEARRSKEKDKKPVAAAPVPAASALPKGAKPVPVEAAPAVKEEKKKEKKSQKERPKSKKKHTKVQIWKLYEIKDNQLKRKNEPCPRCGSGTFLAVYKDRKYCGKCGWAQIKEEKK